MKSCALSPRRCSQGAPWRQTRCFLPALVHAALERASTGTGDARDQIEQDLAEGLLDHVDLSAFEQEIRFFIIPPQAPASTEHPNDGALPAPLTPPAITDGTIPEEEGDEAEEGADADRAQARARSSGGAAIAQHPAAQDDGPDSDDDADEEGQATERFLRAVRNVGKLLLGGASAGGTAPGMMLCSRGASVTAAALAGSRLASMTARQLQLRAESFAASQAAGLAGHGPGRCPAGRTASGVSIAWSTHDHPMFGAGAAERSSDTRGKRSSRCSSEAERHSAGALHARHARGQPLPAALLSGSPGAHDDHDAALLTSHPHRLSLASVGEEPGRGSRAAVAPHYHDGSAHGGSQYHDGRGSHARGGGGGGGGGARIPRVPRYAVGLCVSHAGSVAAALSRGGSVTSGHGGALVRGLSTASSLAVHDVEALAGEAADGAGPRAGQRRPPPTARAGEPAAAAAPRATQGAGGHHVRFASTLTASFIAAINPLAALPGNAAHAAGGGGSWDRPSGRGARSSRPNLPPALPPPLARSPRHSGGGQQPQFYYRDGTLLDSYVNPLTAADAQDALGPAPHARDGGGGGGWGGALTQWITDTLTSLDGRVSAGGGGARGGRGGAANPAARVAATLSRGGAVGGGNVDRHGVRSSGSFALDGVSAVGSVTVGRSDGRGGAAAAPPARAVEIRRQPGSGGGGVGGGAASAGAQFFAASHDSRGKLEEELRQQSSSWFALPWRRDSGGGRAAGAGAAALASFRMESRPRPPDAFPLGACPPALGGGDAGGPGLQLAAGVGASTPARAAVPWGAQPGAGGGGRSGGPASTGGSLGGAQDVSLAMPPNPRAAPPPKAGQPHQDAQQQQQRGNGGAAVSRMAGGIGGPQAGAAGGRPAKQPKGRARLVSLRRVIMHRDVQEGVAAVTSGGSSSGGSGGVIKRSASRAMRASLSTGSRRGSVVNADAGGGGGGGRGEGAPTVLPLALQLAGASSSGSQQQGRPAASDSSSGWATPLATGWSASGAPPVGPADGGEGGTPVPLPSLVAAAPPPPPPSSTPASARTPAHPERDADPPLAAHPAGAVAPAPVFVPLVISSPPAAPTSPTTAAATTPRRIVGFQQAPPPPPPLQLGSGNLDGSAGDASGALEGARYAQLGLIARVARSGSAEGAATVRLAARASSPISPVAAQLGGVQAGDALESGGSTASGSRMRPAASVPAPLAGLAQVPLAAPASLAPGDASAAPQMAMDDQQLATMLALLQQEVARRQQHQQQP